MQIWKSAFYVCVQKQYPAHFTFLILKIIELLASEAYKFLRK